MPDRGTIYARQSAGKAKSITDQITECTADAEGQGWTVVHTEQDGVSASRFTAKTRDAWPRVLAAIEADETDILILWESSRGDRDAETWLGLLRRCRDHGVLIRVTSHERTYNLAIPADWKTLATEGIDSTYESEKLSQRTRRGVAAAAKLGRPPMGPAPYGFRRSYDPNTGELIGQEPDPEGALVVREIFAKVARSVPLMVVANELNTRGVPPPAGQKWYRMRLRKIVLNPAYIGLRVHKDTTYPGGWEPLIDDATFYAAGRVLVDPTRLAMARPGRQVHLLTYLATCWRDHPVHGRQAAYCCSVGCVWIRRSASDDYVRDIILERLAKPDAYTALRQVGVGADKVAATARGLAAKLRADLDGWRLSAARGGTTPESLAVIEADLAAQIREADRQAQLAVVPPALRPFLEPGADVRARWADANVLARRDLIRALVSVQIRPAGQDSTVPTHRRVIVTWNNMSGGAVGT